MGSFNTTCFVSNQTLSSGNQCYVIAIKQNCGYQPVNVSQGDIKDTATSFSSSSCYPDAFWEPVSEFISATYDDYGQVIFDNAPENTQRIVDLYNELQGLTYTTAQGENAYHDHAFDAAQLKVLSIDKAWAYLWDVAVHENRVFVPGYNKNSPRQLTFAIISKAAYDYIICMSESYVGYRKESNKREDVINSWLTEEQPKIKEHRDLAKVAEALSNDGTSKTATQQSELNYAPIRGAFYLESSLRELLKRSNVNAPSLGTTYERRYAYAKEIAATGVISPELMANLVKEMEFGYVMCGLDALNIKISPMVYASQDYDNSVGRDYAKLVRSVSATISKQQKARYD